MRLWNLVTYAWRIWEYCIYDMWLITRYYRFDPELVWLENDYFGITVLQNWWNFCLMTHASNFYLIWLDRNFIWYDLVELSLIWSEETLIESYYLIDYIMGDCELLMIEWQGCVAKGINWMKTWINPEHLGRMGTVDSRLRGYRWLFTIRL